MSSETIHRIEGKFMNFPMYKLSSRAGLHGVINYGRTNIRTTTGDRGTFRVR